MVKYLATLILGSMLLQTAPPPKEQPQAPKLKDSVALNIRTLQLQYVQIQAQLNDVANKLNSAMTTALKDSDLDEGKYTLNPSTLEVTTKPVEKK